MRKTVCYPAVLVIYRKPPLACVNHVVKHTGHVQLPPPEHRRTLLSRKTTYLVKTSLHIPRTRNRMADNNRQRAVRHQYVDHGHVLKELWKQRSMSRTVDSMCRTSNCICSHSCNWPSMFCEGIHWLHWDYVQESFQEKLHGALPIRRQILVHPRASCGWSST